MPPDAAGSAPDRSREWHGPWSRSWAFRNWLCCSSTLAEGRCFSSSFDKLIGGVWAAKTGASPQWTSAELSKQWMRTCQHPQHKEGRL